MDRAVHIRNKSSAPSATDPLNGHSPQSTSSSLNQRAALLPASARWISLLNPGARRNLNGCRDPLGRIRVVGSPQALSEQQRRVLAAWAADCAERVLDSFESNRPGDSRPREAIARTRAFARGELEVADEIRRRFSAGGAARAADPAAAAAARAAGQASSVAHMGAHALGAAAYAAHAVGLADPARPAAVGEEIRWQISIMTAEVRAALRQLPAVGEDKSGPLGPGLLASGRLGAIIQELQADLATPRQPDLAHHDQQHPPQRN